MSGKTHPPFDTVIEEAQYRMRNLETSPAAKGGQYVGWGLLAVADALDRGAQAIRELAQVRREEHSQLHPTGPPSPKPGPPDPPDHSRPRRHE